jgi:hypothetical protein
MKCSSPPISVAYLPLSLATTSLQRRLICLYLLLPSHSPFPLKPPVLPPLDSHPSPSALPSQQERIQVYPLPSPTPQPR